METYFDKPIGTQITILSNSVTQLTEGVNNTQDGLAIVANGNTHPQIASGQYVYVKNHESLADGLYKASTAISTNDPLSTSNLTADDSGGLNDLKDSVDSLNSRIDNLDPEAPSALFTDLAFSLAVADWTLDSETGFYNAVVNNTILLTATAGVQILFDESYRNAVVGDVYTNKTTGTVTFSTPAQPIGTLTGIIRIMDSTTGIVPVHRGGTGAATPKQARANLNAPIRDIPVDFGTVTSLPQTVYDPDLRANMVAFDATFSNPAAIPNGIDVTFADPSGNLGGSVTITGTISGETTIKFWAHEERKAVEGSETAQETQRVQDFVQTNAQTLTPAQKTQVLENIGATEELDGLQEQVDELDNNLSGLTNYSDEVICGYIGATPIYRTVLSDVSIPNGVVANLASLGIAKMINIYGVAFNGSYWFGIPYYDSSDAKCSLLYNPSNKTLAGWANATYTNATVFLEYTKA